jgi:outer membrane protein OmpA-like peptidoglycan-associated protein/tetratricopeptide (TPR) repeat protein
MKSTTIIILMLLSVCTAWGQSRKELADKAFERKEYFAAIDLYNKHLEKDRNAASNGEVFFNVAECYRQILEYKEALEWYNKAQGAQYDQPNLYFQKGRVLLNLGEYSEAKKSLDKFLETQPNDKDGLRLKTNVDFALSVKSDPQPLFTVVNEQLLNTSLSDYGAYYFEDKVVFTSSRMEDGGSDKTYMVDGQGFSNFFIANYNNEGKTWDKPSKLDGISSSFNDGVFTYSADTKMAYFTQCSGEKGEKCRVMQSKYDAAAKTWTAPEPISVAGEQVEMVHPTVSKDGNWMWVVSRKADGKGGSDIWILERRGLGWGEPVNAEVFNTEYDEAYPVYFNDTTMYFSSNGFTGMGGLDLFVSVKRDGQWTKPSNLRAPFNSNADDFLMVFNKDKSEGYFSSNRNGGKGSDDVYSFFTTPINLTLNGNVKDVDGLTPLKGVKVYLTGSDGSLDSTLTDANGNYSFVLDKNVDYKINVSLPEYFGDSKKMTTQGELYSKDFSKGTGYDFDFALMRIPKTEITIDDIYYDYNSAVLRPESLGSLDKLVKLLDDSPDVQVLINSHSDERGDDKYNLKLSEDRAKSVVDYLISKGINPTRLTSKGWGETALLVKNAQTEEEHQKNRRTTFKVVNQ